MKKTIVLSFLFLLLGILIGTKFYNAKETLQATFSEGETYYFLQEGIYSKKTILLENTNNITPKVIEEIDNKYYVYVGISKTEENAKKIKQIYEDKGYNIYIKEKKLRNEEFSSNVTQFDLLINSASTENEILTITEVVLANYEEIIKN